MKDRARAKRAARLNERLGGSDDEDLARDGNGKGDGNGFRADLTDARFAALFKRPEFALDPTDPRFSRAGSTSAANIAALRAAQGAAPAATHQGREVAGAAQARLPQCLVSAV